MSVQSTVTQTKRIPRFGPLFYTVLSIAVLLVAGFFGWQIWRAVDRHVTTGRHLENLGNPDAQVRQLAVEQLAAIGADYSPTLVELLAHQDAAIRLFACEQLGALRPLDKSALMPLITNLTDTDPMVRCYAANAIAPYAAVAVPSSDQNAAIRSLSSVLDDNNSDVREAAVYALGQFSAHLPAVVPTLKSALNDKDANVRLRAAWSLYELDQDNLSLLLTIIEEVMSDDDTSAHSFVFGIVNELGPAAADEMPEVVKKVKQEFGR